MLPPIYVYRIRGLRISGRTRLLFSIHVFYYRGLCEATTGFQSLVAKLIDASDPSSPVPQLHTALAIHPFQACGWCTPADQTAKPPERAVDTADMVDELHREIHPWGTQRAIPSWAERL